MRDGAGTGFVAGLELLTGLLDRHGISVGCLSNSRDTQLLLGPYGPHTDTVCDGDPDAKRAHALLHARATIRLAAAIGAPQVRLYFGCPDFARWLLNQGIDSISLNPDTVVETWLFLAGIKTEGAKVQS